MNNDFKLIAHRGYHLKSKENTLFSFESAIKNNFNLDLTQNDALAVVIKPNKNKEKKLSS